MSAALSAGEFRPAVPAVTGSEDPCYGNRPGSSSLGDDVPARAFITGITGMVGSHLADYLLAHTDWDIIGLTRWTGV